MVERFEWNAWCIVSLPSEGSTAALSTHALACLLPHPPAPGHATCTLPISDLVYCLPVQRHSLVAVCMQREQLELFRAYLTERGCDVERVDDMVRYATITLYIYTNGSRAVTHAPYAPAAVRVLRTNCAHRLDDCTCIACSTRCTSPICVTDTSTLTVFHRHCCGSFGQETGTWSWLARCTLSIDNGVRISAPIEFSGYGIFDEKTHMICPSI